MDKTGVIYILTNPSFPEYVKIGYADDIDKRLQQLNRSECIPFAFRVYATYEVNSRLSDLKIHSIIDKLMIWKSFFSYYILFLRQHHMMIQFSLILERLS